MIKNLPIEENPREKARFYGIEALTDKELLAIVLRTGTRNESVMDLSDRVLSTVGSLRDLRGASYASLMGVKGIGMAKAMEIIAAMELARRSAQTRPSEFTLSGPDVIYAYLKERIAAKAQEHFMVLVMDNRHKLLKEKVLFIGSVNASYVSTREIFKEAIDVNGAAIVVAHNHPSGDARPSEDDIQMTRRIEASGELLNVPMIDHIIVGWGQYYSFQSGRIICEES